MEFKFQIAMYMYDERTDGMEWTNKPDSMRASVCVRTCVCIICEFVCVLVLLQNWICYQTTLYTFTSSSSERWCWFKCSGHCMSLVAALLLPSFPLCSTLFHLIHLCQFCRHRRMSSWRMRVKESRRDRRCFFVIARYCCGAEATSTTYKVFYLL